LAKEIPGDTDYHEKKTFRASGGRKLTRQSRTVIPKLRLNLFFRTGCFLMEIISRK